MSDSVDNSKIEDNTELKADTNEIATSPKRASPEDELLKAKKESFKEEELVELAVNESKSKQVEETRKEEKREEESLKKKPEIQESTVKEEKPKEREVIKEEDEDKIQEEDQMLDAVLKGTEEEMFDEASAAEQLFEREKELQEAQEKVVKLSKAFETVSRENKKLMKAVDEVNSKLEKVIEKKLNSKRAKPQPHPTDQVVKVIEKELRNKTKIIEILKLDNEKLKKQINSTSYQNMVELRNKLKSEEGKITKLQKDVKSQRAGNFEVERLQRVIKKLEQEQVTARDDYVKVKARLSEKERMLKEETEAHEKTKSGYARVRTDLKALKKVGLGDIAFGKEAEKKEAMRELTKPKPTKTRERSANRSQRKEEGLFSEEERLKVTEVLGKEKVERLEKKFELSVKGQAVTEKKLSIQLKSLNKNYLDSRKQVGFLSSQLKEEEVQGNLAKNKLNEYKLEYKKTESKLQSTTDKLAELEKNNVELQRRNKMLSEQVDNFRKLAKENVENLFENVNSTDNYSLKPQKNKGIDS